MAPTASERMALKASLLPRLIRERRLVITKEIRTALRGMSHPARTLQNRVSVSCHAFEYADIYWHRNLLKGIPLSRANANI